MWNSISGTKKQIKYECVRKIVTCQKYGVFYFISFSGIYKCIVKILFLNGDQNTWWMEQFITKARRNSIVQSVPRYAATSVFQELCENVTVRSDPSYEHVRGRGCEADQPTLSKMAQRRSFVRPTICAEGNVAKSPPILWHQARSA